MSSLTPWSQFRGATGVDITANNAVNVGGTVFHLEQAIRAIKNEIRTAPPFHARNNERRAEIDQLEDMLSRRT